MATTKGDSTTYGSLVAEAMDAVQSLQQSLQHTDACLKQVEDASNVFGGNSVADAYHD
jgi:hypothetical protein